MGLTHIAYGALSSADDFNQLIDAWTGTTTDPMIIVTESALHVLQAQQLDTTNARLMRLRDGAGNVILEVASGSIIANRNVAVTAGKTIAGLDVGAHDHSGSTGMGSRIAHAHLSDRNLDHHPQYYNATRHTKAVHDGLGINADTVDGQHAAAFPPWADFNKSTSVAASTSATLPQSTTWADVPSLSTSITITALSDFFVDLAMNLAALANDYTTNVRLRLAITKTGLATTYSETWECALSDREMTLQPHWTLRALEEGTYAVSVQASRSGSVAFARQIGNRRMNVMVLPSTPIADVGAYVVSVPSVSYKMGDVISVTVQYARNKACWLVVNNEMNHVVRGMTNASGLATLTMNVEAPWFAEGSGSPNVPSLFVLSVIAEGPPPKFAHMYVAVGGGNKCVIENVTVGASVTGKLKRLDTGAPVVGAPIYLWCDEGEVSATTNSQGIFTLTGTNPNYVVFRGYKDASGTLYEGVVHNIAPAFRPPCQRITPAPHLFTTNMDLSTPFDAGTYTQFMWDSLNPNSGGFNFSAIDAAIATAQGRGKQITIGIGFYRVVQLGSPGTEHRTYIPTWVQDGKRTMTSNTGWTAVIPNYAGSAFQAAFQALINALGAAYNGHPGVAAIYIGAGIDDEAVVTKDTWNVKWKSDRLYTQVVSDGQWAAWLAAFYDWHVAAFPTTPKIWGGFRPPARGVYRFASDGVVYKTNAYGSKGLLMSYGGSGKNGCIDVLEGIPCGCEPAGGALFTGSRPGADPGTFVESDLSGHLLTIANMILHGNAYCDFFPEYLDPTTLLEQPIWQRLLQHGWAKDSWWILIREVPATSDGKAMPCPSNGATRQRGHIAWLTTIEGGSLIPRSEWLASGVPTWSFNAVTRYDLTSVDCLPFESKETTTWYYQDAQTFTQNGRKGTVTLHFLGAPAGTYNVDLAFFGTGGFYVGGVYVPTDVKKERFVALSGVTLSGPSITIELGENYLTFFHLWS